ncbi:aminoglycoside phosphotransferase family protein [Sorangium sp. So ce131]|uniref:aminoglycoside phosphotransferase family protein n=1 Tax=Sorangium sp. So ce131 TaxID=3133282 RepID=UPI003F62BDEB
MTTREPGSGAPPLALAPRLLATCQQSSHGRAWLAALPALVAELVRRWSLALDASPGGTDATCSFVALVHRSGGERAALKIGLPEPESEHEIEGLLFWDGDPSVRVLESDRASGAMLIERCEPGTPLSTQPEPVQDEVIARCLRRLWRAPPPPHPFRPLRDMTRYWADAARAREHTWPDRGFGRAGLELLRELSLPRGGEVLLATDLHAGNVLAARREPWLVIDPKPYIGDAAYDATQHLLNCVPRLSADPWGTVSRFAALLGVSAERVRSWLVARLAQAASTTRRAYGLSGAEAVALARAIERSAG